MALRVTLAIMISYYALNLAWDVVSLLIRLFEREVLFPNYRAIIEVLSAQYALILTAVLISVITCVTIRSVSREKARVRAQKRVEKESFS